MMIAHVSPASSSFEESRNTLTYAERAKRIKTKVCVCVCVCGGGGGFIEYACVPVCDTS